MTIFRLYKEIFFKSSNWNIAVFQFCPPIQQRESIIHISQFSSVAQSSLTLQSMLCSKPGFPVHQLQSLLKLLAIESVVPSNHLILCCPLVSSSVFPSIRVFFSESVLRIRWPEHQSFSISPSNEYSELISFRMEWCDLLAVQETQESSPTPQFKSINSSALQLSL